MKTIPLTQGKSALVDDQDYRWLSKWKWRAKRVKSSYREFWYAYTGLGKRGGSHAMHRMIMLRLGHSRKFWADHKDADGLNNQRSNLRFGPPCQNNWNKSKDSDSASPYKGVCWHKRDKMWVSSIMANGKSEWLGYFSSAKEAAIAYDAASKRLHSEFGKRNFI